MAWAAVLAVARVELRTRWRALAVLGLLFGLMGGAVIATAVVTRRTDSAYSRLVAATHRHDASVLVAGDRAGLVEQVTRLPGVDAAWTPGGWVGKVRGDSLGYLGFIAGPDHPSDLFQPVVLQGRAPRDDAPDEILVSEAMTQDFMVPVGVGTQLELTLLSADQFARFDTGFGEPAGERIRLRVVGIGRLALWSDGFQAIASPAFAARYRSGLAGYGVLVRLGDQASARQAFAEGLDRLAAANPPPPELAEFGPLRARYTAADQDPVIAPARRVLVAALTISTGLAGLATVLVIVQALARHHAIGAASQRIEAVLGMSRAERALARTLPVVPAVVLAGVIGASAGLAAGQLQPLGSLRRLEPAPGYLADPSAASVGGVCLAVLVLFSAVVTAASLWRPVPATAVSGRGRAVPAGWRRPGLRAGWCLAGGGAGRTGPATVAAILGLAASVATMVAAVAFGASLDRLVTTPPRYGWTGDFSLLDAKDDEIARLVADDRVAALDLVTAGDTRLGGEPIQINAFEHRKGVIGPALIEGRLPAAVDEIAIGPRLAAQHQLRLGDELVLTRPDGGMTRLQVVGIALVRSNFGSNVRLGSDAVVHPDALLQLVGTPSLRDADIRAAAGKAGALATEMRGQYEITRAETEEPPPEIAALADIRLLPYVLAAIAGAGAAAGLLHGMYAARRRNRRQFAILAAIGFTGGQLRTARTVMAISLVVPALAIGVPVGLAAGRLVWYEVAVASGVGGDALVPASWLIIVAAGALLAASVAAILGRPRSSEPVGSALRVE